MTCAISSANAAGDRLTRQGWVALTLLLFGQLFHCFEVAAMCLLQVVESIRAEENDLEVRILPMLLNKRGPCGESLVTILERKL